METYELRTYVAVPGRMGDLQRRFRDHTIGLFAENGMEGLGYWVDESDPNVLIYLLRHRGDAPTNWEAFRADPRWISARDASEVDGPLTISIEQKYLLPTDLSGSATSAEC